MSFFVLGRNPALSLAEIQAVLEREKITYTLEACSREVCFMQTAHPIARLFTELGGSIKYGEVAGESTDAHTLLSHINKAGSKVYFGFSFYALDDKIQEAQLRDAQKKMHKTAMEIKKYLRESGVASRFVVSRDHALSSVVVKTNRLVDGGTEFVFFLSGRDKKSNKILFGKTQFVQEFEAYEYRDFGRPKRNIRRGMLPPKIAKIMINLAKMPKAGTLLDPFCGEGTILAEAAVTGHRNLIGFDVDQSAVDDTRINLEWIKKQYTVNPACDINQGDIRELASKLPKHTVDAIVTEPYLGPLLRGTVHESEILKIKNELERLYEIAFKNFEQVLKPGGCVVFIFPVWRENGKNIFIDLNHVLPKSFSKEQLLPKNMQFPEISERGGIIWERPDQKILREILVFQFIP